MSHELYEKKENEGKEPLKRRQKGNRKHTEYETAGDSTEGKERAKREFRVIIGHWPSVSLHLRRRISLDREI